MKKKRRNELKRWGWGEGFAKIEKLNATTSLRNFSMNFSFIFFFSAKD